MHTCSSSPQGVAGRFHPDAVQQAPYSQVTARVHAQCARQARSRNRYSAATMSAHPEVQQQQRGQPLCLPVQAAAGGAAVAVAAAAVANTGAAFAAAAGVVVVTNIGAAAAAARVVMEVVALAARDSHNREGPCHCQKSPPHRSPLLCWMA